jgi:tRNA threonylcarbamoyladenosine biosynthesis protein TsaE
LLVILKDELETQALGASLAVMLRPGDVIALSGDLGAGKTTLARAILSALGLHEEAPSPTFAIVQPYDVPEVRLPVWHVDLYRLDVPEDADELGLEEARDYAALLIEWPERLGASLWADALRLRIEIGTDGARRLTAQVPPAWEGRWPSHHPR